MIGKCVKTKVLSAAIHAEASAKLALCSRGPTRRMRFRFVERGMILVVVLVIIALLALLGVSFSFRMNAELAAVGAMENYQQARFAAESGINRAILLLRDKRTNMDEWYSNQEAFRRILVWAPDREGGSESLADQEVVEGRPAWRFSIVSYDLDGDEAQIRYGLTDEASKINLNIAPRSQLLALFDLLELEDVTSEELADALIDWRDKDDQPVSENGAESSYYMTLEPRYRAKNKPLETVEELLMIKGFNGRIVFGEDYNRNGYLDENENDGEEEGMFPPDNGDGILNRGLLPLVTVYSWDWNSANDNKRRININAVSFSNTDLLPEYVTDEIRPEVIEFIAEAKKRRGGFYSVGELLGLEVYENGVTNYDGVYAEYQKKVREAEKSRMVVEESEDESRGETEKDTSDYGRESTKIKKEEDKGAPEAEVGADADREKESDLTDDGGKQEENEDQNASSRNKRNRRRQQSIRDNEGSEQRPDTDELQKGSEELMESLRADYSDQEIDAALERLKKRKSSDGSVLSFSGRELREEIESGGRGRKVGEDESSLGWGGKLREPQGTPIVSPVTPEDMPALMDRLTVVNKVVIPGLINVNTASPKVLATLAALTEQDVEAIVSRRTQISGEEKMTTAWLVTSGALSPETFALVSNQLTARSIQFSIDAIGFADHVGAARRIQVIVEMRGELSHIKYYRDITSLGIGYPVKDDERSQGFAFNGK